jgi:hypothetical protein
MEDAKFYDGAFQDGIGIYIRREQEGIFKEVIPQGFGPLSGKYTSKEMLSYFNGYKGLTNELINNELIGGVYTNLMYLKGFSQAAKTIYSHTTHVKNVAGGVQMSLANGINVFDAKQSKEIIDILRARTKNNKDRQEFHELLSELGLLNKGVVARDLQGLAGDLATRKKGFIAGKIDWAADKIGLKKLANKAQNAYIAEDDFFKINMFIREEKNLKKINDLLPETLQKSERQIQEEAAKIVRSVLPNYDLVPEFFKQVRAVPFMGRFFSFMSESVRISYGTVMQGRKEFQEYLRLSKLGHKEAANEYLKRSARRIGSFTAMAGTGAAATEKVSQAITGLSDAEMEAYKDFLPDYMRNSRIAVSVSEDGVPMIGNLSSWDAYDYPKKVIKLIGKDFYNTEVDNEKFSTDLLNNLFGEAVSPFLGESMIAEPLLDYFVSDGKTKTGSNMSYQFLGDRYEYIDYGDPTANKLGNLNILFGKLMTETLLPGSVDRLVDYTQTFGKDQTRYDQNIYETDQFIKFVTGWGMSPMNKEYLENIHGFKSSDYSKMKSQHRNNISNGIGDVLEYEKFIDNYIDVNMLHYKNFAKYTKFNESAELLGLNTTKLMYEHNISRNDRGYIRQGRYKPLTVTEDMRDKMRKRDENKVLNEIMPDIYSIDRILGDMPVLYDDNHYKVFKEDLEAVEEKVKEIKEKTRLELKTGGRVLNVEEDPIDRTNPFTGNTYSQDAERLGFFAGGSSNVITQAFKKAMQLSLGTTALVASEPVQATEQYKKYMGQYEYKPRKMFNEGAKVSLTPEEQYVEFYNMAMAAGLDYPDAVAAQASLESGHGKSELTTKYNNPLGIKVNRPSEIKQGQQSVKMDTQEFFKGKEGTYKEPFRVYNNLAESFVGYKEKVSAPRYNSIREAKNSDEYLVNIAKSGYATDPKYAEKTINIKNRYAYLIKE